MIRKFPEVFNFNWLFVEFNRFIYNSPPVLLGHGLMPRSHQTFRSVLAVKLLGIMLRNR